MAFLGIRASTLLHFDFRSIDVRLGVKTDLTARPPLDPFIPGGLNRSPQHFILEGKDGVWDGTEIS